ESSVLSKFEVLSSKFKVLLPPGPSAPAARIRQRERDERRVVTGTRREDNVLLTLVQIGHRHGGRLRWDRDGADLFASRLVDRIDLRRSPTRAALTSCPVDDESLGGDHLRLTACANRRKRDTGEHRIRARHLIKSAVRDPPRLVAALHVVSRDAAHF